MAAANSATVCAYSTAVSSVTVVSDQPIVLADNARAIRLYERAGYNMVTQQMRKSLTKQGR
jgi:hypothetical protein